MNNKQKKTNDSKIEKGILLSCLIGAITLTTVSCKGVETQKSSEQVAEALEYVTEVIETEVPEVSSEVTTTLTTTTPYRVTTVVETTVTTEPETENTIEVTTLPEVKEEDKTEPLPNVAEEPEPCEEYHEEQCIPTPIPNEEQNSDENDVGNDFSNDCVEEQPSISVGSYIGTFEATAYTHTGNPCASGNYPYTSMWIDGVNYRAVASSSAVFPLGTKLYIEAGDYTGYVIVEDRGVSGWTLDLFMDSYNECINWGRRNIEVYYAV